MHLPQRVGAIWAQSINGVIGRNNDLPEEFLSDLALFKEVTKDTTVVMGRKTWESLPRKPLPGRVNVVLTKDKNYKAEGAVVIHDLQDLNVTTESVFFIGGSQIYELAIPFINELHVTVNAVTIEGDAYAPCYRKITDRPGWSLVSSSKKEDKISNKAYHAMFYRKKEKQNV